MEDRVPKTGEDGIPVIVVAGELSPEVAGVDFLPTVDEDETTGRGTSLIVEAPMGHGAGNHSARITAGTVAGKRAEMTAGILAGIEEFLMATWC